MVEYRRGDPPLQFVAGVLEVDIQTLSGPAIHSPSSSRPEVMATASAIVSDDFPVPPAATVTLTCLRIRWRP